MFRKLIGALILLTAIGGLQEARADTFNEIGDAGELLGTAQNASVLGTLDAISGNLSNLSGGLDDVDLYRILIVNPAAFSVTVTSLLGPDDTQLFLFDSTGTLVLSDDDSGTGFRPQFNAGDLTGATGTYYLAYSLYDTNPSLTAADVLNGWNRDPAPQETGAYTLTLTSASPAPSAVPEPNTIILIVGGLGMLSVISRKRPRR